MPRTAGWVLTRTADGAAPLTGSFTARSGSDAGIAMLFAVTGRGAARRMSGAFSTAIIEWGVGYPRVYGGVQPACPTACVNPVGTPFTYLFSSNGHRTDATIYVATWDMAGSTVQVTSPGWRVDRWKPDMRVVSSEDAGDVGVTALHTAAGRFTGAAAPGGRYGSVAWAHLPCSDHGEGSAKFTGGVRVGELECARAPGSLTYATRGTKWRLDGSAWGVSSFVNVLVVVDLPRG